MEFYQQIEKDICGKYRKKIWRPFMSAVKEYRLAEKEIDFSVQFATKKEGM